MNRNKDFNYNIFLKCKKIISLFKNIFLLFCFLFLIINIQNYKLKYKFLLKEIKSPKEKNLFIKNKTKFYFYRRTRFLKKYNLYYNESKLVTFQDKLNWLIIHECPEYKSDIVDKIKLHEYSKKILGKDICVPILKIYDNAKDINFDELPNQFVLKLNHGCAMNIVCKDKSKLNYKKAINQLKIWKNINYGLKFNEFQYMYVKRTIYAEKFLKDNPIDYKIFCFNGKAKFIRIREILKNHTKIHNHYDLNWNLNNLI